MDLKLVCAALIIASTISCTSSLSKLIVFAVRSAFIFFFFHLGCICSPWGSPPSFSDSGSVGSEGVWISSECKSSRGSPSSFSSYNSYSCNWMLYYWIFLLDTETRHSFGHWLIISWISSFVMINLVYSFWRCMCCRGCTKIWCGLLSNLKMERQHWTVASSNLDMPLTWCCIASPCIKNSILLYFCQSLRSFSYQRFWYFSPWQATSWSTPW